MSAPSYRWVCHRCGQPNEPGIAVCSSCGCSAVASGRELAPPANPAEATRAHEAKVERNETLLLFFPEALFAGVVALAAPVWAVRLMFEGHAIAGVLLVVGVALGVLGFFWFMRRREKWLAYFSVVGVLFVAYLVNSAVEPPSKCEAHAQPCNAPDLARKAAQGR